jgi:hypothetical protein
VVERLTAEYLASVLTFIALLAAIGTSLLSGCLRLGIALFAPLPRAPAPLRDNLLLAAGASGGQGAAASDGEGTRGSAEERVGAFADEAAESSGNGAVAWGGGGDGAGESGSSGQEWSQAISCEDYALSAQGGVGSRPNTEEGRGRA